MKYFSCLFLVVFFSSLNGFSQEKIKQHIVAKGETIEEIAKKYNVKPSAIYELNPDAVSGIKPKKVLLIPTATHSNTTVSIPKVASGDAEKTHEVLAKETLYGIAKQYQISIEDLYKMNPNLEKEGLKIGQNINLPSNASADVSGTKLPEKTIEVKKESLSETKTPKEEIVVATQSENKSEISIEISQHEVLPKESLYSIARLYKISVAALQKANPELGTKSLKPGQMLSIPTNVEPHLNSVADTKEEKSEKENPVLAQSVGVGKKEETQKIIPTLPQSKVENSGESVIVTHEVLPKESLYSIAKLYKITLSDLQKANPELGNKSLKPGQKLSIPTNSKVNLEENVVKTESEISVSTPSVVAKKDSVAEKSNPVSIHYTSESSKETTEIIHEVLPKESLYSISKLYKISVADLQKSNPKLGNKSLKPGQKLSIPTNAEVNPKAIVEDKLMKTEKGSLASTQSVVAKKDSITGVGSINTSLSQGNNAGIIAYTHEVLPKETKYGIAREYGISVTELEKQNPSIAKKLLVGYVLKISSPKIMDVKSSPVEEIIVKGEEKIKDTISHVNRVYDEAFVEHLIASASENIGIRYRSGGTTKDGFDCSGLMCYAYGANDIQLPRSSMEMASYGSVVDTQNAQKGDLIFFKTSGRDRINHVGMVVEVADGEIKFIHSSSHGVMISSTKESYYGKRVVQVNRVL